MGKRIYYHGTSIANLPDILKNGIQPVPASERVWTLSNPNFVYLWEETAYHKFGKVKAQESGAYSTVTLGKEQRIVVFKIVMPDKNVQPDNSSESMLDIGSVQVPQVSLKYIEEYYVSVPITIMSSFILATVIALNSDIVRSCDELTKKLGEQIEDRINFNWVQHLFFLPWETVTLKPQRHGQSARHQAAAEI